MAAQVLLREGATRSNGDELLQRCWQLPDGAVAAKDCSEQHVLWTTCHMSHRNFYHKTTWSDLLHRLTTFLCGMNSVFIFVVFAPFSPWAGLLLAAATQDARKADDNMHAAVSILPRARDLPCQSQRGHLPLRPSLHALRTVYKPRGFWPALLLTLALGKPTCGPP